MSSLLEQTFRPLWLGGTRATANTFFGAPGALLKGIGDYSENDTLSSWGNSLLDFNAGVQQGIQNNWADNLGDDNSSYTQIMGVLGEAIPAFAVSTFAPNNITSVLAQSLFESGEATGDFATDMHNENRYDKEAQHMTLKNFLTNLAINTAINSSPAGEGIIQNIGHGLRDEIFLQEPLQRAINQASHNAVEQHSSFAAPLLLETVKYPLHLWDTFAGDDNADLPEKSKFTAPNYIQLPAGTKDKGSYISNIMTMIELGIDPTKTRNEMMK